MEMNLDEVKRGENETLRWNDVKSVLIQNRFRKCIAREERT